jgi:hypothetical protein
MPLGFAEQTPGHRIPLIGFNRKKRPERSLHFQPLALFGKEESQVEMGLGKIAVLLEGLQIRALSFEGTPGTMVGQPKHIPNP